MLFFNFCLFPFSKFQMTIVKNLIMDFECSWEVLIRHKYFSSTHFWQRNIGSFKFLWNLHRNAFCFFIFSKWKKHYNPPFDDTFKMLRIILSKPFVNYGPLNMLFLFCFFDFLFTFVLTKVLSKKIWNNYHFLMQISKSYFKM